MTELAQQTLTGREADTGRTRPKTFIWCYECDEPVLRSRRFDHPHDLDNPPSTRATTDTDTSTDTDTDDEEEDAEPERVGSWYDVKLSYSVDYRFRIPAWSEHEAKERAADLKLDAVPADSYQVHDRISERGDIMSDDPEIPDDWDPYAGEPLWVVFDDDE